MPQVLLLTRSITHAQRICAALQRAGIAARYFRPPVGLTGRGCGYAVRISPRHTDRALDALRLQGLQPVRTMYGRGDGTFSEIE